MPKEIKKNRHNCDQRTMKEDQETKNTNMKINVQVRILKNQREDNDTSNQKTYQKRKAMKNLKHSRQ